MILHQFVQATELCDCYPLGLASNGHIAKVRFDIFVFTLPIKPACLPNGTLCYHNFELPSSSCTIPCHGIYSGETLASSWLLAPQMWSTCTTRATT